MSITPWLREGYILADDGDAATDAVAGLLRDAFDGFTWLDRFWIIEVTLD